MNVTQFLNRLAYPQAGDNARKKDTALYVEATLATGTTRYTLYNATLGDLFARNKKLPISGSEIFWVFNIKLYLETVINTSALFNSLMNFWLFSYIEFMVNNRLQIKLPLYEILNFPFSGTIGNDTQPYGSQVYKNGYNFYYPVLLNSNASVSINLVTNSTGASDFNGKVVRCEMNGIQADKLDSFYYDAVANNMYQDIDFVAYDINQIASANQTDFSLFVQSSSKDDTYQSLFFPLPANQRFQLNAIEIFTYGDDAATDYLNLLYNNRGRNYLSIDVDNTEFFQGSAYNFLSLGAIRGSTFTDGTTTTDYVNMSFTRNQKILKIPLIFPATAQQNITLSQPGSSLSVDNYFITLFKGFIKRQVA